MANERFEREGDAVEVDPSAFRVAKPHYKLVDLLAQCKKDTLPPADMAAWDSTQPVGKEISADK